ncbi:TolC family protein [Pseudoalteromonas shioyasakiensis]|uniref:TolC family protein n=1 Tax=Pseudoalteromonas shioyasakiensis TaxID=1190813 RepID=UPI002117C36C|nr:TolC family protein [Pseudoalteromonas shioyasakiensis]MCQ8878514.1 TolC family protein [Pseudoalteromonas shioyasakiensis]
MSKLTLAAVAIAGLLSGCASKIDEQQYQADLQSFVAQTQIASQLQGTDELTWWQQLDSAQLNELVVKARASNHNLKTSQLQLQSALARLGAQRSEYLPQGNVSIDTTRSSLGNVQSRQSQATVNLDWQVDLFGKVTALVDAANAGAMSQAEQVRLLHIEVVSSVAKGFVSYQGNKQKQQIINLQIDALQQSIAVLKARVEEGVANELDLNRTLAQLKQQQSLLPEIEYAQFRDLSALAVLTGQLSSELTIQEELSLFNRDFTVSLASPSDAIALRPDISRALFEFSQANSLSVAATKTLLPDISLTAFAGVVSLGYNQLSNTQQQWQVSPQIKWSLLSYPALLAQRDAQQFLSKAAFSQYQHVVINAMAESELSLQLLVKQTEQNAYAKERFNYANNAFLQAQAMYQEGQIPYLELLDARQDVLIAQENAVDSTISSLLAKVDTYQVFNGRWSYALVN